MKRLKGLSVYLLTKEVCVVFLFLDLGAEVGETFLVISTNQAQRPKKVGPKFTVFFN